MKQEGSDNLYARELDWVENFTFDESVANVFQDMIVRSVPGYRTTLAMIGVIVSRFVTPGSRVYDLGCSLGAGTLIAANANPSVNYEVIGVDTAQPMLQRCQQAVDTQQQPHAPVRLLCEDIRDVPIENASVILLNFTLQFVPVKNRQAMIQKIYEGLNFGGVLILSEKIHFEKPGKEKLLYQLHHDFKKCNGYSDLEISQKRNALENTLVTETLQTHQKRLLDAGFESADLWFQCFNFASLVAVKKAS
jgi:tRNA (cmo5U34)-methyltransferase